jgi:hypothetical protein
VDTVTYVQSYRVGAGPLWIWGLIAAVCAGVLVLVFLVLFRSPHRPARWLLVALLLGALLNGVLAWRAWDAWGAATPLGGCRWAPPSVCERFYAEVAHTIAVVTVLGPVTVLGTMGLCLATLLARHRPRL